MLWLSYGYVGVILRQRLDNALIMAREWKKKICIIIIKEYGKDEDGGRVAGSGHIRGI